MRNRIIAALRTAAQVNETRPDGPTVRDLLRGSPPQMHMSDADRAEARRLALLVLAQRRAKP